MDSFDDSALDRCDYTGREIAIHILDEHAKPAVKVSTVITHAESTAVLASFKEAILDACKNAMSSNFITSGETVIRLEDGGYKQPHSVHSVDKANILSWVGLGAKVEDIVGTPFNDISVISFVENGLEQFISSVKRVDSLMLVIGGDVSALSLHDNWCSDEDRVTLGEIISLVEKRMFSYEVGSRPADFDETGMMGLDEEGVGESLPPPGPVRADRVESYSIQAIDTPLKDGNSRETMVCKVLNMVLARGHEMPAPTLRVALHQTRTATDMYGKSYTIYNLVVKQGGLEWTVERRYSDFAKLHESLGAQDESETGFIPRALLPHMPSKKLIKSRSLLPRTVDKRRIKLGRYINSLIALEPALSNHLILSFLGMINTARFDSVDPVKGISRNTIHISKIRPEARVGDLILFKCANTLSHLQRRVTRSEWDHVGLVVRSVSKEGRRCGGSLDLLEATGEGVTAYPLTGRLKAYHYNNFTKYMCIRQLHDFDRSNEVMSKLDDFVSQVVGKPYGFSASKIFPRKNQPSSTRGFNIGGRLWGSTDDYDSPSSPLPSPKPGDEEGDTHNSTFFCSELVAAALKELGLIPKNLNAGYFWPGSFARHDEIDTVLEEHTAYYGDELIIDCRVMEISRAIERKPPSRPQSDHYVFRSSKDHSKRIKHHSSAGMENEAFRTALRNSNSISENVVDKLRDLSDDSIPLPELSHFNSSRTENVGLSVPVPPQPVDAANLLETQNDSDDSGVVQPPELSPRTQNGNWDRTNSKHTVSMGLEGETSAKIDEALVNSMLLDDSGSDEGEVKEEDGDEGEEMKAPQATFVPTLF
mmetsp:Transcript_7811/g.11636  ORF Transcript_7811/g.11636 Transcript_7811/m.11636 type:complete len:818 (+) Transcript_7811:180-2633(+)|eukprot:CAMPEP_0185031860 /NCGR_PEP_ID=MMETSP1103-20130426/19535_1 /TAXON_ID=36769 /ORGANISM="Paraphysomonas bandaiensis, Strain Caron Lab Isolate" /LENGTH=817 /DNA_ID=CAMNT_0027567527 /DNA_START=115 /DNA_END=2568 /DNA_ORIENTATION=-